MPPPSILGVVVPQLATAMPKSSKLFSTSEGWERLCAYTRSSGNAMPLEVLDQI